MKRLLLTTCLGGLVLPGIGMAAHKETFHVAMRDGTLLATDAYIPDAGPAPTVLIRTPYGKGNLDDPFPSILCDRLGFSLVIQDTRGQGDSEGIDQVFFTDGWGELQDGFDTVEWIVAQPFSDGSVGEMGVSAMGIAANFNAGALHPALKTIHVGVAATDFYEHAAYQGGSFREALVVDWLEGQGASYMIDTYQQHRYDDDFWTFYDARARMSDQVSIPIFHYGGFHDIFTEGTLSGYTTMAPRQAAGLAGEQRLVVGPWTHIDAGAFSTRQGELTYPEASMLPLGDVSPIGWFNRQLKGVHRPLQGMDHYPVRIYLMGDPESERSAGNYWAWSESWPPPSTDRSLFLTAEGGLSDVAQGDAPPLTYISDPSDPSPTIGGRELSLPAGPRDQRPLLDRSDVLVFETEPLKEPYTVVGMVQALLFVSSDAPDTDFTVRLTDVYPDGRSMLVADGITRARARRGNTEDLEEFLIPGQVTSVTVQVGSTAQVFDVGHKIQVIISSSNHRRFKVAGNTDLAFWDEGEGEIAANSVYVDSFYGSKLLLPNPRRGSLKHFPEVVTRTRQQQDRAVEKVMRGEQPIAADELALVQATDRALLEMLYTSVVDTYTRP